MKNHKHIAIPGGHVTWTGEYPPTPEFMEAINNLVEKAKEKVVYKKIAQYKRYYSDNGIHWLDKPDNPDKLKYIMEIPMTIDNRPASDKSVIKPVSMNYVFIEYEQGGVDLIMKLGVPDKFYMKIDKPKSSYSLTDPTTPNFIPPAWRGKSKFKK